MNIKAAALFALLTLCACAPTPRPTTAVQLASDDYFLRVAAVRALKTNGVAIGEDAATRLRLWETVNEDLESVAADGSVGSYRIDYRLFYALNDGGENAVSRSEVIDHDANAYWASAAQRRQAVDTLRAAALTEMFYLLELE